MRAIFHICNTFGVDRFACWPKWLQENPAYLGDKSTYNSHSYQEKIFCKTCFNRCPSIHFKCVLIHKKVCLPNSNTYTLLYKERKLYFSFSENDLANQSTKTGTTYVYLEVYSKVFTTSQIEAGNVSTCYEKDTYFLEGYASLGSRFQKNVVTTVEVRFQIWECELTAWCFRMIPPWWSHLQTH